MKRRSLCLLILALASGASWAQPATRAEVQAQRAAIERQFAREKAECNQRFAVSACVEELAQRQRAALAPLIAREHELAAEERQARAAAQAQRVKEREQAASQDDGHRGERLVPASPAVPASHPLRTRDPAQAALQQRQAEQKAQAEAAHRREQARERELQQRQRIADHQAREKRRTKPAAAPLPLPSASAASG